MVAVWVVAELADMMVVGQEGNYFNLLTLVINVETVLIG